MPLYAWKGLDGRGKPQSGTREADGPKSLRQNLRRDAIYLTEMREARAGAAARSAGSSKGTGLRREVEWKKLFEAVKPQEVAIFTRQLATLLKAGIPLAEALGALTEQSDNRKLEEILGGIRQRVNEGGALADALAAHPTIFPDLYTNMVRSGETAGNLDAVLSRLADFLDSEQQLKSKVMGALMYPMIMTIVGSLIMGLLMVTVVPKITEVFEDLGQALPWNTQLLIFLSQAAAGWWWAILLFWGAVIWGFRRWLKTPKGRATIDRLWLRLWVVGPLVRYVAVARFSRTLATMLSSGVPVLTALEIVKRVLNNVLLEKVVEQARDSIREGESVAAPLKRSGEFPSMMCHMVAVGERSGQLETMLENVAGAYERDVDAKVQRLTSILSPLMIVSMAVAVGFIVYSVMTPILKMQQFVQ